MNAALVEDCRGALQLGLGLLLQSGLLLGLGLSTGWLLRRRGAALRAFVCQMTLAGVVLGAVLSVGLAGHVRPIWGVHLAAATETPPARGAWRAKPLQPPPPAGEGWPPVGAGPLPSAPTDVTPPRHSAAAVGAWRAKPPPAASPYPLLAALWAAGTGALLLWLLACQAHLTCLRRRAQPITAGRAAETLARLAASRALRAPLLRHSPRVRSPFLAGISHPAIFLPSTWGGDFDDATLHAVLAHELAHLTRRDCAWTLLLRLTTALLWPQALLWLLARQWGQATEEACDLLALTPDCPPRRYADCLLRLAERAMPPPIERVLGAGIVPVRSSVGRRIQTVLDRRNHTMPPLSTRLRLGALLGTAAAVFGSLSLVAAPAPVRAVAKSDIDSPGEGGSQNAPLQGRPLKAFGYGIMWGVFPKHMAHHLSGYFVSAAKDSPAARAGIPAGHLSALVSINGRPVAAASSKAVAALFRLPPPLNIRFLDVNRQAHRAMLRSKADFAVGSAVDAPNDARAKAMQTVSVSNLRQIGLAFIVYAQNHDGLLPDADRWTDELLPFLLHSAKSDAERQEITRSLFHDPSAPGGQGWSYAFNRALSGARLSTLKDPANAVVLFESSLATKNATDAGESLPHPGWHGGQVDVCCLDGRVKSLPDTDVTTRLTFHPQPLTPATGVPAAGISHGSPVGRARDSAFAYSQRTRLRSQAQIQCQVARQRLFLSVEAYAEKKALTGQSSREQVTELVSLQRRRDLAQIQLQVAQKSAATYDQLAKKVGATATTPLDPMSRPELKALQVEIAAEEARITQSPYTATNPYRIRAQRQLDILKQERGTLMKEPYLVSQPNPEYSALKHQSSEARIEAVRARATLSALDAGIAIVRRRSAAGQR